MQLGSEDGRLTSTTVMCDSWKDLSSTTTIFNWIENRFPSATSFRFVCSGICFIATTKITRCQFSYFIITARIFQFVNDLTIAASLFSIEILLALATLATSHSRCDPKQKLGLGLGRRFLLSATANVGLDVISLGNCSSRHGYDVTIFKFRCVKRLILSCIHWIKLCCRCFCSFCCCRWRRSWCWCCSF